MFTVKLIIFNENYIKPNIFQLALLWLSALACGRRPDHDHPKRNNTNKISPTKSTEEEDDFSDRSYGFNRPVSDARMPTDSSELVLKQSVDPPLEDYGEPGNIEDMHDPEKMDSHERLKEPEEFDEPEKADDNFEQVKKLKEVSIFSLLPKERIKALDPVTDQQSPKTRILRPGRDVSIIVRNRHHPVLIARQVPIHWIPYRPHRHHRPHYPAPKPVHPPSMPKHEPCKPCKPKVHKKHHHHKPKKPKKKPKKPKKEHCHGHHKPSKKPHHKKLIYYAPMPTAMNYFYKNRLPPMKTIAPSHSYDVNESPENEDENVEAETEKPFSEQIEDDVEEHRLAEITEPFYEEEPTQESNLRSLEKL